MMPHLANTLRHSRFALAMLTLAIAADSPAQGATLDLSPATQPVATTQPERFASKASGVAFDPPAGLVQLPKSGAVENVAHFRDDKNFRELIVTRLSSREPLHWTTPDDPKTKDVNENDKGIIRSQVLQLSGRPLSGTVVREDVIKSGRDGNTQVAMLAARFNQGPRPFLKQRAIVRAHDQLFYLFDYTTARTENVPKDEVDPSEKAAVDAFRKIIDTVEVDPDAVTRNSRDAEERLFRTRALLVNVTEKNIAPLLIPEQCYLFFKDGKPIGYSFITEEFGMRDGQNGLVVSIRSFSRSNTDNGATETRSATENFCMLDRSFETWINVVLVQDDAKKGAGPQRDTMREFGVMSHEQKRIFDQVDGSADINDDKNPPVRIVDNYKLNVTTLTKNSTSPQVERLLPPFYAPNALSHVLPRLLPFTEVLRNGKPRTYLVAVWNSAEKEVYRRYLDLEIAPDGPAVLPDEHGIMRRVQLLLPRDKQGILIGQPLQVKDYLGLDGTVTFHYFSPQGRYLGSHTPASGLSVIPTTADTLRANFADADLTPVDELRKHTSRDMR